MAKFLCDCCGNEIQVSEGKTFKYGDKEYDVCEKCLFHLNSYEIELNEAQKAYRQAEAVYNEAKENLHKIENSPEASIFRGEK